MMKEDKTAKQEELKTAMDQLSAEITELSTSIKENTEAVASLEGEVTERARAYSSYSSKQVYHRKQLIFGCQRLSC